MTQTMEIVEEQTTFVGATYAAVTVLAKADQAIQDARTHLMLAVDQPIRIGVLTGALVGLEAHLASVRSIIVTQRQRVQGLPFEAGKDTHVEKSAPQAD